MQCDLSSIFVFLDRRAPSAELPPNHQAKDNSVTAIQSCFTDSFSMLLLELGFCLVFLLLSTRGLPIPSGSSMASFGVLPIAYSRRELSPPDGRSSAVEYSPVSRPQVWGGTPANTSICVNPALWTGKWRSAMIFIASALVFFYGLLAFVMWGIMSVDLPRLMVWNRTGDERRR